MVITLDWTIFQIALIIMMFLIGLGVGAGRMFAFGVGLLVAWIGTEGIGPRLERLVNRILGVGAAFASDFLGDPNAPPTTPITAPTIDIPSPDLPLWKIGFLLLVALPIVIFVIRKVVGSGPSGLFGRFWGGVMGALAGIFLLGKVTEYWRNWVTAPGHSDPLAALNLRIAPELPTIVFGGPSTSFNWAALAGLAILLIFGLVIAYAVWRVLKAAI